MENASKALIIAGAILLAILIIGLGVFIYNQSANAIGNTGIDQLAIQQINSKFESYEGIRSGAEVYQLFKDIMAHNYEYRDDESLKIMVKNSWIIRNNGNIFELETLTGDRTVFVTKNGLTYEVRFDRNNNNYLIRNVNVEEEK